MWTYLFSIARSVFVPTSSFFVQIYNFLRLCRPLLAACHPLPSHLPPVSRFCAHPFLSSHRFTKFEFDGYVVFSLLPSHLPPR